MIRTWRARWIAIAAVALSSLLVAAAAEAGEEGFVTLFNGKDLSGFKTVPSADKAGKTFQVNDGIIVVSGNPNGYFYTDKSYMNYVLVFDWKYKRPANLEDDEKFNGNSGCLVHIQGDHKVWPKCVEVQGMNKEHGKIFAIGGAKGTYKFDAKALKEARKKVGEWNTTEITCKDGEITSKVNGAQVATGKGELTEGPIGFQSEGAELYFKNIKIKVLK